MNAETLRRHRIRNALHSLTMLLGMGSLLAAIGYFMGGVGGVLWMAVLWMATIWFAPRFSPRWVLRMSNAYPLSRYQAPEMHRMMELLAEAAELPKIPRLYYIPDARPNALSLGDRDDPHVAVTEGLLRMLSPRELLAVLAHEVSHINNHDLRVMGWADSIGRMTSAISFLGQLLLLLQLPLLLFNQQPIPWLLLLLLIFAPTLSRLLQLALSRTREFEADLEAARLIQDPMALASALQKLEYVQHNIWMRIFWPTYNAAEPSIFRTHPVTKERIERLLELRPQQERQERSSIQRPSTRGYRGMYRVFHLTP